MPFEYLLVHALPEHLLDTSCQGLLVDSALNRCHFETSEPATTTQNVDYIVRHLLYRLSAFHCIGEFDTANALLIVLANFLAKVKAVDRTTFASVKSLVIAGLKDKAMPGSLEQSAVEDGLLQVHKLVLDVRNPEDRMLVTSTASAWIDVLKQTIQPGLTPDASHYAGWWIRFAQPGEILELLEVVISALVDWSEKLAKLVGWSLAGLKEALGRGDWAARLATRSADIVLLFKVHQSLVSSSLGEVHLVEALIASLLESDGIPVGIDGQVAVASSSLPKVVEEAERRWSNLRTSYSSNISSMGAANAAQSLLSRPLEDWTDATEKIVCNFVYQQKTDSSRNTSLLQEVADWVANVDDNESDRVVGVAYALFDCTLHRGNSASIVNDELAAKVFKLMLRRVASYAPRRAQAKECLYLLLQCSSGDRLKGLLSLVEHRLKSLKKTAGSSSSFAITAEFISFARFLASRSLDSALERIRSIVEDVIELGLQALIRKLGEEGQRELDEATRLLCEALSGLIREESMTCKAGTLETLLGVVIQSQYHLAHPECLDVVDAGLVRAGLKVCLVS